PALSRLACRPEQGNSMATSNTALKRWVEDIASHTKPASIHWCDGSDSEYQALLDGMLKSGDLISLNPRTYPRCYLHRSDPSDVARVEHLTFVCTPDAATAGPNDNWMAPDEAHR